MHPVSYLVLFLLTFTGVRSSGENGGRDLRTSERSVGAVKNLNGPECLRKRVCPNNLGDRNRNFVLRNCFCDHYCRVYNYGDCCENYNSTGEPLGGAALPAGVVGCTKLPYVPEYKKVSWYMVSRCPVDYKETAVKILCEGEETDLLSRIVVTSRTTGILYRNIYCSACHGDLNATYWKASVNCNEGFPTEGKNLTSVVSTAIRSSDCSLRVKPPSLLYHVTRLQPVACKPAISSCDPSYSVKDIIGNCISGPASFVYQGSGYATGQAVYKNLDCALCNYANRSDLACMDTSIFVPFMIPLPPESNNFPISILFYLNGGSVKLFGRKTGYRTQEVKHSCDDGYVFDFVSRVCKAVRCAQSDEIQDGRCVPKTNGTVGNSQCVWTTYNVTEYLLFDNKSLYLTPLEKWFTPEGYYFDNSDVIVCTNFTQNYTMIMFKFSEVQAKLSFIGQLISIIALAIHAIVYLILPSLHNVPGKNLLCLVFSLLGANLVFLTAINETENQTVCAVIGIFLHYAFLAAFFWMNVMSYDIWRTFAKKSMQSHDGRSRRFNYYALYAWISPGIIIIISQILDNVKSLAGFRPRYGFGVCWITNRPALFVLFGLPVAVLLTANLIFYILTVYSICMASKAKELVQSKSGNIQVLLYIKLSAIMGLTWIFGFIATSAQSEVMWYLFIVFNSLQGLFIFLAFVCNRRVMGLLREKFCKGREKRAEPPSGETKTSTLSRNTSATELNSI